ncbi:hypothetical protein JW930_06385 [Candidatus Woesearchaeota archaeon]|nr:hypothetical protein [Candidatus Woesearchaeota archaeon]
MDTFHEYMKKQLIDYILAEEQKGVPLEKIEQVLLDAGHQKNIIDECFDEFKREGAGLKVEEPSDKVAKDMASGVKNSIKSFFSQISSQKEIKNVKKDTTPEQEEKIIQEAVKEVRQSPQSYLLELFFFLLYLVGMVFVSLFTAGSTGDEFVKVIVGLSPSYINAFLSFAAISFANLVPLYMLIPVAIGTIFYILGRVMNLSLFSQMEVEALGIINILFSMIFNIFMVNLLFLKPKPRAKKIERSKPKEEAKSEVKVEPAEDKEIVYEAETKSSRNYTEINDGQLKDFQKHINELREEFDIK